MPTATNDAALAEWERAQPAAMTGAPVWRLNCYREALFMLSQARGDVGPASAASAPPRSRDQLVTAVASIAANVAEGYARTTAADRIRFFSYALGSTEEAIVWYQAVADGNMLRDRTERLARIRRMLIGLSKSARGQAKKPFMGWR